MSKIQFSDEIAEFGEGGNKESYPIKSFQSDNSPKAFPSLDNDDIIDSKIRQPILPTLVITPGRNNNRDNSSISNDASSNRSSPPRPVTAAAVCSNQQFGAPNTPNPPSSTRSNVNTNNSFQGSRPKTSNRVVSSTANNSTPVTSNNKPSTATSAPPSVNIPIQPSNLEIHQQAVRNTSIENRILLRLANLLPNDTNPATTNLTDTALMPRKEATYTGRPFQKLSESRNTLIKLNQELDEIMFELSQWEMDQHHQSSSSGEKNNNNMQYTFGEVVKYQQQQQQQHQAVPSSPIAVTIASLTAAGQDDTNNGGMPANYNPWADPTTGTSTTATASTGSGAANPGQPELTTTQVTLTNLQQQQSAVVVDQLIAELTMQASRKLMRIKKTYRSQLVKINKIHSQEILDMKQQVHLLSSKLYDAKINQQQQQQQGNNTAANSSKQGSLDFTSQEVMINQPSSFAKQQDSSNSAQPFQDVDNFKYEKTRNKSKEEQNMVLKELIAQQQDSMHTFLVQRLDKERKLALDKMQDMSQALDRSQTDLKTAQQKIKELSKQILEKGKIIFERENSSVTSLKDTLQAILDAKQCQQGKGSGGKETRKHSAAVSSFSTMASIG